MRFSLFGCCARKSNIVDPPVALKLRPDLVRVMKAEEFNPNIDFKVIVVEQRAIDSCPSSPIRTAHSRTPSNASSSSISTSRPPSPSPMRRSPLHLTGSPSS